MFKTDDRLLKSFFFSTFDNNKQTKIRQRGKQEESCVISYPPYSSGLKTDELFNLESGQFVQDCFGSRQVKVQFFLDKS